MSFIFCCSLRLLGASILSVLWAFSSSQSVSSALLPTRPVVQHCVYCLGRNFSFDYHMIHSLAVVLAYVMCVLLPRPQSSRKSSTSLIFVSFVVKRVAGNLSCGKQAWSTLTRFSGFPSSPRVYTYRAQPCLSFLSQDPIPLYPCSVPSLPWLLTQTQLLIQASRVFCALLQSPLQNLCKRCPPFCQRFKSNRAGAAVLSRLMLC